jgi:DNA primase
MKYKSSPGFPKAYTLYNYDNVDASKPVIVVESPTTVLYMLTMGFDNVVGTFGKSVPDAQVELLRSFEEVIMFFDFDWAGNMGNRSVLDRLSRYTKTWMVPGNIEWKTDPCDYTADELKALLDLRVPSALVPAGED